jgi:glycosyltransferase involved in cell wall biosynthesis
MRVCVLAYSFYEVDTRIQQYVNALIERGDEVDVIALRRPDQSQVDEFRGATVYRIQTRAMNEKGPQSYLYRILSFVTRAAFVMLKLNRGRRYDIVHVHSVPDFMVFSAIPLRFQGIPVILDIHDVLPEFYASKFHISDRSLLFRALTLVERISARFATHVIIANDLWKERLEKRSVPAVKCSVFCNYPDPETFQPRPRTRNDGKFVLLYPGSLNFHQGLDVAIRAFAMVAKEMPNAEFHICGEGADKAKLVDLTKSLGMEKRVLFHDWMPLSSVVDAMSNADLAVVAKRASNPFGTEAASTKITEFMAMGVPVIVSRTKIDSFYHTSEQVEFFESENEPALAAAILRLSQDEARRAELTRSGLQYVREHSWKVKKHEYLDLVDTLAGSACRTEGEGSVKTQRGGQGAQAASL